MISGPWALAALSYDTEPKDEHLLSSLARSDYILSQPRWLHYRWGLFQYSQTSCASGAAFRIFRLTRHFGRC